MVYRLYAQRIIVNGVEVHLRYAPTAGSHKIIAMKPNPVASWELRLGDYRILYDVDDVARIATVHVIGEKRGNRLLVQGQEFYRT